MRHLSRDLLARAMLEVCDEIRLEVTGACMAPVFDHADLVDVRSVRTLTPEPGDVVLVDVNGHLKLHRLERVGRHFVSTRPEVGKADPPVARCNVLGVLVRVNGRAFHRQSAFSLLRARARRYVARRFG
jgi:hypothetical protein